MPKSINKDLINGASIGVVLNNSYGLIERLDHLRREDQLMTVAALFHEMLHVYGADPQEVMGATANMLASRQAQEDENVRALRLYIKHELEKH